MRLTGLRDDASINDHSFGDRLPFDLCHLHLRNWTFRFLFFSAALSNPNDSSNDQNCGDRPDDDSLFHLELSRPFDGR
jgi:hypothetical protein